MTNATIKSIRVQRLTTYVQTATAAHTEGFHFESTAYAQASCEKTVVDGLQQQKLSTAYIAQPKQKAAYREFGSGKADVNPQLRTMC